MKLLSQQLLPQQLPHNRTVKMLASLILALPIITGCASGDNVEDKGLAENLTNSALEEVKAAEGGQRSAGEPVGPTAGYSPSAINNASIESGHGPTERNTNQTSDKSNFEMSPTDLNEYEYKRNQEQVPNPGYNGGEIHNPDSPHGTYVPERTVEHSIN